MYNYAPYEVNQFSVDKSVQFYISNGVPPSKIMIGAAFYSRGFAFTEGLGYPGSGIVPHKSWESGVSDYKDLPRPGSVEHWDSTAKATYSYDAQQKVFLSYDSPDTIREKWNYVWKYDLKGILAWESSGDFPIHHPRSLVRALFLGMWNGTDPLNLPEPSKFETPMIPVNPSLQNSVIPIHFQEELPPPALPPRPDQSQTGDQQISVNSRDEVRIAFPFPIPISPSPSPPLFLDNLFPNSLLKESKTFFGKIE